MAKRKHKVAHEDASVRCYGSVPQPAAQLAELAALSGLGCDKRLPPPR